YRLVTAERELLEHTLQGSVGVIIEILSLVNPAAFSRTNRIRRYVRHMAQQLNLPELWQYELAAMLSQIGCVVVPPDIMERSYRRQNLSKREEEVLSSTNDVGRKLLAKIPRLEKVSQMVAQQQLGWSTGPLPTDEVPVGAHLLRIALDFDEQVLQGKSLGEALAEMRRCKDYNPRFVDALRRFDIRDAGNQNRLVVLNQLKPGMIIDADLYSNTGMLLLGKGHEVTESAIARLESFASLFGVAEPISVIIPANLQEITELEDLDLSNALAGITSRVSLPVRPD
ncbi:MAG TPA: HD domain-containing phosphohydrolase, partial [Candidatus Binataceae bacterium]|nr:HD domain-containing phosphohydrolase [Candidatus Binataceae bacterium]